MKKILSTIAAVMSLVSVAHADGNFMPTGNLTTIPYGAADYCKANPTECEKVNVAAPVHLDVDKIVLIVTVNDAINKKIEPVTDKEHFGIDEYWTLPKDGKGDCEDIALLKAKVLEKEGIPASDLLMTVVLTRKGEGHAVLTVRTDAGDYILDNLSNNVVTWNKTPYRFLKREANSHGGLWVDIDPSGKNVAATSKK